MKKKGAQKKTKSKNTKKSKNINSKNTKKKVAKNKENKKQPKKSSSKNSKNQLFDVVIRYSLILLSSLFGFWLFYYIFTPLTIYPVSWILSLFFSVSLIENTILINGQFPIELVPACIIGSAYFLLFALNLSIPKIKIKKRVKMIVVSFLSLLFLNILRIFAFAFIFMSGYLFFDIAHKLFWYGLSTLFVVIIWFAVVKKFNVKEIPLYSDLRYLYKQSHLKKK